MPTESNVEIRARSQYRLQDILTAVIDIGHRDTAEPVESWQFSERIHRIQYSRKTSLTSAQKKPDDQNRSGLSCSTATNAIDNIPEKPGPRSINHLSNEENNWAVETNISPGHATRHSASSPLSLSSSSRQYRRTSSGRSGHIHPSRSRLRRRYQNGLHAPSTSRLPSPDPVGTMGSHPTRCHSHSSHSRRPDRRNRGRSSSF